MTDTRFNSLTRLPAVGLTRRRIVQGVAALGTGGALAPASARALPPIPHGPCGPMQCPDGYYPICATSEGGGCIGCTCVAIYEYGIAGGGRVVNRDQDREGHLSLVATRIPARDNPGAFAARGQVTWADPGWEGVGLRFRSAVAAAYGPTAGVESGRDIAGWFAASVLHDPVPFLLQAVDTGAAGSGRDTVRLLPGAAVPAGVFGDTAAGPGGLTYTFEGTLAAGDLALIALPGGESPPVPGTPVS